MADRSTLVRGPAVLVSGRAAALLGPALDRLEADHRRNGGGQVDAELVEVLAGLRRAGYEWAAAQQATADDCRSVAGSSADSRRSDHDSIDTAEAAALLGCNRRNVVDLCRRGRLRGELVEGRWSIERASVIERKERTP